jgi:hypothetical protein
VNGSSPDTCREIPSARPGVNRIVGNARWGRVGGGHRQDPEDARRQGREGRELFIALGGRLGLDRVGVRLSNDDRTRPVMEVTELWFWDTRRSPCSCRGVGVLTVPIGVVGNGITLNRH